MRIKEFVSIEKTQSGYVIHTDYADIMLIFMTQDILRIRVSFQRFFSEESYTLVTTAWEDRLDFLFQEERRRIVPLQIPYEETDETITFCTERLMLVLYKNPLSFVLYDRAGNCIYRDLPQRAFEQDILGRLTHYSCMDRETDHFYGFGEKTGHLDKRGRRMRMSPKDAIGHDPEWGDPLYKHIPFYIRVNEITQRAIGMFYNNTYDCTFDIGNEISGYWEPYIYYQTEGGDIDLFLLGGPDVKNVLEQYTFLTGRTAMPARHSLGFTASTMYYAELESNCDEEILKVIDQYERSGIGIDNFWLASGYSSGEEDNLRYVFNWNHRRFPEPERFLRKMGECGIHVIPNLKPGILKTHPYKDEFSQSSAFVRTADGMEDYVGRWWGGEGYFVDFTNPDGRYLWKKLLKENILSKGVKTVWNDNCEYDGVEDREAQCDFEGKKSNMAQLKAIHPNMMAYTGRQALEEMYPDERPYIINRAGFAGIQRYAQVWGGDNHTDWKTLQFNIPMILGMGLSGIANTGCDIGGFAGGAPEAELLLRWIQNGIFQPRFCMNSANDDNTVTQPWMYEENIDRIRAAYIQRYEMLPYLYSYMYQAHKTGLPVWRPLFMEFPKDRRCYSDKHFTFLFGESVLVANVVEKNADYRKVYLPYGCCWYDIHDHLKRYEGGQEIEIPVTLDSIPMFLRGDGIFVTSKDIQKSSRDIMKNLDILMGTDGDSQFVLYEDDGHTKEFEKGMYSCMKISVKVGDRIVISCDITGDYPSSLEKFHIHLVSKDKGAYWVRIEDKMIPQFLIKEEWEAAERGWYYNLSDRSICLTCEKPDKKHFEIVVSREKFDLIGMSSEI